MYMRRERQKDLHHLGFFCSTHVSNGTHTINNGKMRYEVSPNRCAFWTSDWASATGWFLKKKFQLLSDFYRRFFFCPTFDARKITADSLIFPSARNIASSDTIFIATNFVRRNRRITIRPGAARFIVRGGSSGYIRRRGGFPSERLLCYVTCMNR